jgi:NADH-quinone oxidoreductase subunit N
MSLGIDLQVMLPEIVIGAMACVVLLAAAFDSDREQRLAYWLAQAALLAALTTNTVGAGRELQSAFGGMFLGDPMAVVLKSFVFAVAIVNLIYTRDYLRQRRLMTGEYFALALFAVLGMQILISAGSLITVYLGLELLSLSLYSLVAMQRGSAVASEAAMKYFVLGAIASGVLLYGMSILYGLTGSLDLAAIAAGGASQGGDPLRVFALVFIVAGIAFKLGVAPFHMWLPDVYHGAPTSVTLFIATAPKLAAFAMAMRLVADGLPGLAPEWQQMFAVLAILSMAIGNLAAIAQDNIKRMLAYSTIAHMGFLLLGVLAASRDGYAGAMFYAIVYALMSMGAFGMIILLGRHDSESDRLADFRGLARRSPWFSLMMLILMFSLAGVPPFAGFWAKWFVLKETVAAGQVWLAAVAVGFSIIGAYYYLRIVKLMYFDPPEAAATPLAASADLRLTVSINGLVIFLLGIAPGLLMTVCLSALR